MADQPLSGKGGTVFLITGVLFVGYLYLSRRLVAVYRAIRYGTQQVPVLMGERGGDAGLSPYVPGAGETAPRQPPILPPTPPQMERNYGYADIPWKDGRKKRDGTPATERAFFYGERGCRVILYDTLRRHGYSHEEALDFVSRECLKQPLITPGAMIQ